MDPDAGARTLDLVLSPDSREEVAKNLALLDSMAMLVKAAAPAEGSEVFVL